MSPIFVFLRDVWIRTQCDAVTSRHATNLNLATYLPKLSQSVYTQAVQVGLLGGHKSTPVKHKHILLLYLGAFTVNPLPDFLYEAFMDYCMVRDAP
jgi:hypothetical protein